MEDYTIPDHTVVPLEDHMCVVEKLDDKISRQDLAVGVMLEHFDLYLDNIYCFLLYVLCALLLVVVLAVFGSHIYFLRMYILSGITILSVLAGTYWYRNIYYFGPSDLLEKESHISQITRDRYAYSIDVAESNGTFIDKESDVHPMRQIFASVALQKSIEDALSNDEDDLQHYI